MAAAAYLLPNLKQPPALRFDGGRISPFEYPSSARLGIAPRGEEGPLSITFPSFSLVFDLEPATPPHPLSPCVLVVPH